MCTVIKYDNMSEVKERCKWKDASEIDDLEFRIEEKILRDEEMNAEGLENVNFSIRVNVTPITGNQFQVQ